MDYNQLYQQYSGFTDPFGRRREEEEDAVGNARPVTQTIRTDPVTGEQTMTIKGSPQDLSAANPLTPTVSMPGSTAGGFMGGYQDMAPAPQMQPQMQPQPTQAGGFLGGYQDMAPAPQMAAPQMQPQQAAPEMGGFLGAYQDMAPAPQMQPQQAAPEMQPPVAPVAPQAPPMVSAPPAQPSIQAVAPGAAPAPQQAAPEGDYTQRMLAGLRQREGNYNTPPHSASSAQGAYGITAPAYSDIQRADPYFANRAQGQLTPEDQDRAALVLRGLNQQRLRSQGVEPSEANQQLAHFLGPKGAADYLASGYISPEAAAANGGVEKVRQIAEERLAFGRSLSSPGGAAVAGVGREMGMNEPGFGGGESPQATQFSSVQSDRQGLIRLLADPSLDPATRRAAETQLGDLYRQEQAQSRAEKTVADALSQKNGGLALDRLIKKEGTEGSYIKAYLFQRLGLTELAREEQQKLGAGDKWTSTTIDGKQAYVKFNAQGLPVAGIDESGDLTKDQLLKTAAVKNLDIVGGTYVNDRTGEVGRVLTDKRTGESYIQTDSGRKPMSGFRPQSSTGTLGDMRTRMLQEVNLKLQGKSAEEQMAILRPYNQALVGAGQPAIDPSEVNIRAPQISSGTTAPVAPAAAPVAPAAAPVGSAPGAAPTRSNIVPLDATGAPVTAPTTAPTARPTMAQIEAATEGAKKEATVIGEDVGKLKGSIGKAERNADYLLTKIDELVKHPGFETSVGAQGASYLFGMLDKPLPPQLGGGDARDWIARFKEVQGQQFLQAIETLRGTGSITETEGQAAKAAIARMSESQTEKEFRVAAQDFQNVIRRGLDGHRVKIGKEPKYNVPAESEMGKTDVMKQADEIIRRGKK